MPTYEYRCPEGHTFEKFQRMSDPATGECPECGQAGERILSGGAGLLFKGDGFYITDYRSDSYRKAAAKDKPGGESGSAAKSESKGSADAGSKGSSGAGSKGESSSGSKGESSSTKADRKTGSKE